MDVGKEEGMRRLREDEREFEGKRGGNLREDERESLREDERGSLRQY